MLKRATIGTRWIANRHKHTVQLLRFIVKDMEYLIPIYDVDIPVAHLNRGLYGEKGQRTATSNPPWLTHHKSNNLKQDSTGPGCLPLQMVGTKHDFLQGR
jgi:hypothetical protein